MMLVEPPKGRRTKFMTEAKQDGIYSLTVPVVMSFPNLFEAKAFKKGAKEAGEPKFSANFNFPSDSTDLVNMKKLAAKLARTKWPDKPFTRKYTEDGKEVVESVIVFPFVSGDKLADERKAKGKGDGDYTRGHVVLSSRSKYAPRLSIIENGHVKDLDNEAAVAAYKGKFYNGVLALAQFNFVAYDAVGQNGKPGVTAYLQMVLSTGKGDRLSGGQSAAEAFKGYVGSHSAEDPTAPGAGENMDDIPL